MTAQYTYLTTDLTTNKILGEIPVNNVSLDCQLNSAGNMSSGGHLSDKRITDDEFIARTVPGKTAFWAIRENTIVWGGILWTRTYQSDGKSLTFTGQTFESYASRRFPRQVIGKTSMNVTMGQSALISFLWGQMQSIDGGSIGVLTDTPPPVDPTSSLTINGFDLSTSYADLIQQVTQLSSAPDWTVAWTFGPNQIPLKQLQVGAPLGNTVDVTQAVVDYPGSVVNYTYTENASAGANQWWATGDGSGTGTVMNSATDTNSLNSGWPILESVNNYSGVTSTATAGLHASSDLTASPMPLITHSALLFGKGQPEFGTYGMGDYFEFNVKDPRFPLGLKIKVRVIGWTIQPPDEGSGVETITPVFDEPTGSTGA